MTTTLWAPAKLTLTLAVTGVRADGYHELRSEMVALSLSDILRFTDGREGMMIIAEPGTRAESLPVAEDNLVARALRAVGRKAMVRVDKRIPLEAVLAAAPPMRRRCCVGLAPTTCRWPSALVLTCPSA